MALKPLIAGMAQSSASVGAATNTTDGAVVTTPQTLTGAQAGQAFANLSPTGGAILSRNIKLRASGSHGIEWTSSGNDARAQIIFDEDHGGAGVGELKIENEDVAGTIYLASLGALQIGRASTIAGMYTYRHTGQPSVGTPLTWSVADLHYTTGYNSGSPISQFNGWQAVTTNATTGAGKLVYYTNANVNSSTGLVTGTVGIELRDNGVNLPISSSDNSFRSGIAPIGANTNSLGFRFTDIFGGFKFTDNGDFSLIRMDGAASYLTDATNHAFVLNLATGALCNGSFAAILSWATAGVTIASGCYLGLGNTAASAGVAGTLAAATDKYLILKDDTGTSYKIPVLAA